MEQNRDEHIVCADCGVSFLFSAGEAAVFAERGLAAPKRCKECRRARKERAPSQDRNGNGHGRASAPAMGGNRGGAPRYTGDVNEYRSPMQDSFTPAPAYAGRWGGDPGARRGRPAPSGGSGPVAWGAPAGAVNGNVDRAGARPAWGGPTRGAPPRFRQDAERAPVATEERQAAPPATGPRRRAQAEMFSITCNSCGANAEVPFKPAEGRDVYCQACYRARKPA